MEELIYKYFPHLTEEQICQFSELGALYREWNNKINVISRKDIDNLYLHHVLHSLAIARFTQFKSGTKVLDVGTGGGFPGIPLAIYFPETQFTLCDSIGKKIRVVKEVISSLSIKNAQGVEGRAESVKDQFDFVVSRAVTALPQFIPWVWQKILLSTQEQERGIIYLKGGDLDTEIAEAAKLNHIPPSKITREPISNWFSEEWFLQKEVIFIKR